MEPWEGRVGAEFLVGFAPHVSAGGEDDTQVESYMANVIAAVPLDTDGRWQPFVSGGFGAPGIRHEDDEFDIDDPDASDWGAISAAASWALPIGGVSAATFAIFAKSARTLAQVGRFLSREPRFHASERWDGVSLVACGRIGAARANT